MPIIGGPTANPTVILGTADDYNGAPPVGERLDNLADTITGTASADVIVGDLFDSAGYDTEVDIINGGAGNDRIYGDTINFADIGLAAITFPLGNPTGQADVTGDTQWLTRIEGSADQLYGGTGDDTLFGGGGNDILDGGADSDELFGASGVDTLIGGTGADSMSGGAGNDLYLVDDAGDIVTELASEGVDRVQASVTYSLNTAASQHVENLSLSGSTAITATGNALANEIRGDGNTAANSLIGLGGDDVYVVDLLDTITEATNSGTDTVVSFVRNIDLAVFANVENIQLEGTTALTARGNVGDNEIRGDTNTAGNALTGLGGDDTYIVGTGDTIVEAANGGTDTVSSSTLDLSLADFENVENITLTGSSALTATGNAGANQLRADVNVAANVLTGLAGDDFYILGVGDTAIEAANGGTDTVASSSRELDISALANIENVTLFGGSTFAATGNSGDNVLDGEQSTGANALAGQAGDDLYVVGIGDTITETLTGGTDTVASSTRDLLLANFANVENVRLLGGTAIDATGNAGDNRLDGSTNSAANTLTGLGGDDFYILGVGDTAIEAANGGTDTVASSSRALDISALANIENITLFGTSTFAATGNDQSNVIDGEQSTGANALTGRDGGDFYIVGSGDTITETADGGTDTVASASRNIDLTLTAFANVENVRLLGTDNLTGTGDDGSNQIDGSTNSAANVLTGLAGDDFYILGVGDTAIEAANGGSDTVASSTRALDISALANIENVTLFGTSTFAAMGNSGANILDGQQSSGANALTGLTGNDTYLVGNGDTIVETSTGGNDTVVSATRTLTLANFLNVESATLTGTLSLSATGNSSANQLSGEQNTAINTLTGLAGNDFYILGTGDRIVETTTGGTDTAASSTRSIDLAQFANVKNITLFGASTISAKGNTAANVIDGQQSSGANALTGLAGNDTYLVGNGDTIIAETSTGGTDTVISSTRNLTLTSFVNVENATLSGTAALSATGNTAANQLSGEQNTAINILTGLAGNDFYILGAGDRIVETTSGGTDTAASSTRNIDLTQLQLANVENIVLFGASTISAKGNSAANVIDGQQNTLANALAGGAGNDTYQVGTGDTISETSTGGTDTVTSATRDLSLASFVNVENVTLLGALALTATGSTVANQLNGETNTAANRLIGLAGNDFYFLGLGDTIAETAGGGTDTAASSTRSIDLTPFTQVENIVLLGSAALSGKGNALANTIDGQQNTAANILTGGGGNDTFFLGARDTIVEAANGGTDQAVSSSVNVDISRFANVERVTLLGTAALSATGNSLGNIIDGSQNTAGNLLSGGAGNDTYIAGVGDRVGETAGGGTADLAVSAAVSLNLSSSAFANVENALLQGTSALDLTGNAASNVLTGNTAANVFIGNLGNDLFVGGGGADTFFFTTALNSTTNVEFIADFAPDDTIRLENAIFTKLAAGALSENAFKLGTGPTDADDRIIYNRTTGDVIYDPDGTGAAGPFRIAILQNKAALTAADFVIV